MANTIRKAVGAGKIVHQDFMDTGRNAFALVLDSCCLADLPRKAPNGYAEVSIAGKLSNHFFVDRMKPAEVTCSKEAGILDKQARDG